MCFSCDGRHLVIQTGAPEWTLHYVAWEKGVGGKVAAVLRNVAPFSKSVAHVEGHPVDPALIATSGRGFVRLFRFQDDALKAVPINLRRDPGLFSCHAWLPDDRLILGTVAGDLWFVEVRGGGWRFHGPLACAPPPPRLPPFARARSSSASSTRAPRRPTSARASSRRFRRASSSAASAARCASLRRARTPSSTTRCAAAAPSRPLPSAPLPARKPRASPQLSKAFSVAAGELSRVVALALSPNEEDLSASCASGQAYTFKLASYELYKDGCGEGGGGTD